MELFLILGGGFKKEDRLNPPKIGEFVTFKYYGFTKNGKPKFASFLRVREVE
jgi:DNA ligase-1